MANTYQPFGQPTNSDYGKPRGAGKTHWGQDFTAESGTQIPSATAGTVIFSGYNPSGGLGWCVVVKDTNGVGHVYAHMGVAKDNNNANKPPPGMPTVGEKIDAGDSLGPVGNTGQVTPLPTDRQPYLGTHLHIATVDADATRVIEAQGKTIGSGGSGSLGVKLDGSTTLNPDSYLQDNPELFRPSDASPIANEGASGSTYLDDVVIVAKRPVNIAGDAIDADLPDGTRVVSTSTTVNGQTTVTADLLDKDGNVLLHAGAGQTMERDPDTGIVQVRTGTSDQVQQYNPATGEVSNTLTTGSDAANVYENLLEVFSNPQVPTDKGVQVADASDATGAGTMTNAGWIPAGGVGLPTTAQPDAATSSNTFTNFLDSQGNTLNPAQQQALATQIDKLGLGGEGDLSFYPLPNGSALIANADGEIVGEINRNSATGDLQLKATAIDADGNSVEVNNHIGEQGQVMSDAAVVQGQASYMFNSLMAVNNWGHMNDLGKLSALVNLYNATDKLGEAFGATGDNLPGDLGAAAGYLQLAQGLQNGDNLIIANGLNTVSGGAVDQAIGRVVGEQLPYVSTLLELRNFADNPEQAMLTMAGTYVGEAANDDEMRKVA